MLTIRLTRKGKKNQPFFKIVVIDKRRSSKGGRAVEELGYLDPLKKRKSLNKERILYWIQNGAQPSPTIHNLLISEKIAVPDGIRSSILEQIKQGKKIHVARVKKSQTPAPANTSTPPVAQVSPEAPQASLETPQPDVQQPTEVAEVPKEEPKS